MTSNHKNNHTIRFIGPNNPLYHISYVYISITIFEGGFSKIPCGLDSKQADRTKVSGLKQQIVTPRHHHAIGFDFKQPRKPHPFVLLAAKLWRGWITIKLRAIKIS